jgi:hypothetical protein
LQSCVQRLAPWKYHGNCLPFVFLVDRFGCRCASEL